VMASAGRNCPEQLFFGVFLANGMRKSL